jgi:hypothetical protein
MKAVQTNRARPAGRLRRRLLAGAGTCAAGVLIILAPAAPASAGSPTGIYAGLGDCPLTSSTLNDPSNLQAGCTVSVTNAGSVTIGSTTVPLTSAITLQFGAYWPASAPVATFPDGSTANIYRTVPPADGKELVGAPLQVPIPGIVNIIPGVTSVFAQVQLAGSVTNFVPLATGESYPVFQLPIKIHVLNALLGLNCYIGTDANPILLQPMTGTTNPPPPAQPVTGDPGVIDVQPDPNGYSAVVASFTGATLVDNAFAVPGASGCGLFGILDPLVNSAFGLPSPAGHNAIVFGQTNTSLAVDGTATDLAKAIAASSN